MDILEKDINKDELSNTIDVLEKLKVYHSQDWSFEENQIRIALYNTIKLLKKLQS